METYDQDTAEVAQHVVPVCSVVHAQKLVLYRQQLFHAREDCESDVLYSRDLLIAHARVRNVGFQRLVC